MLIKDKFLLKLTRESLLPQPIFSREKVKKVTVGMMMREGCRERIFREDLLRKFTVEKKERRMTVDKRKRKRRGNYQSSFPVRHPLPWMLVIPL